MFASRVVLCAVVLLLGATSSARASILWFDLSDWNHAQVVGGGQTFVDVFGNMDLEVSATGSHPVSSMFNGTYVVTGNNTDANMFSFELSEAVDLVFEVKTLDGQEMMTLASDGSLSYEHIFGAEPTITGGMTLTGNGFGINPTGATQGIVRSTATDSLTVYYEALANNKFELFRIGVPSDAAVPEPAAGAMLALGIAALSMVRRRQRVAS